MLSQVIKSEGVGWGGGEEVQVGKDRESGRGHFGPIQSRRQSRVEVSCPLISLSFFIRAPLRSKSQQIWVLHQYTHSFSLSFSLSQHLARRQDIVAVGIYTATFHRLSPTDCDKLKPYKPSLSARVSSGIHKSIAPTHRECPRPDGTSCSFFFT